MVNFYGACLRCTWAMWCSDSCIDELKRKKIVWRSKCANFRERRSLACRRPRATGECAFERAQLQYLPLCTMSSQLCSRWHGGAWLKCPKLSLFHGRTSDTRTILKISASSAGTKQMNWKEFHAFRRSRPSLSLSLRSFWRSRFSILNWLVILL